MRQSDFCYEVLDTTKTVVVVPVVRVVVVAVVHPTVVLIIVERTATQQTVSVLRIYPVVKTASDNICVRRR